MLPEIYIYIFDCIFNETFWATFCKEKKTSKKTKQKKKAEKGGLIVEREAGLRCIAVKWIGH